MNFLKNLFNRNKSNETIDNTSEQAQETPPSFDEQQAEELAREEAKKVAERHKHKHKLIHAIALDDANQLFKKLDQSAPDDMRKNVYEKINSGEFSIEKQRQMLSKIKPPMYDNYGAPTRVNEVYTKLWRSDEENSRPVKIMEYSLGDDLSYNHADPNHVLTFIETFPTPIDFEETETKLLDQIQEDYGADAVSNYQDSLNDFKHIIYGKRQDYYETLQKLKKEAKEHADLQTFRESVINTIHQDENPTTTPPQDYAVETIDTRIVDLGNGDVREIREVLPVERLDDNSPVLETPADAEKQAAIQDAREKVLHALHPEDDREGQNVISFTDYLKRRSE